MPPRNVSCPRGAANRDGDRENRNVCLSVRERKADADWGGRARRVARRQRESRSGRAARWAEPASTSPTTSSFQHERGTWTPIRVSRFTSRSLLCISVSFTCPCVGPEANGQDPRNPGPPASARTPARGRHREGASRGTAAGAWERARSAGRGSAETSHIAPFLGRGGRGRPPAKG